MKKFYCLLITSMVCLHSFLAYASTPSKSSTSPPGEPIFPIEELIEKPSPATDHFISDLFNMLATLGLIVALILIAGWFLKRLAYTRQQQANVTSSIKILEKRMLSPKSVIYLIEIEGTGFVLTESMNGITKIAEFPIAADNSPTFDSLLSK